MNLVGEKARRLFDDMVELENKLVDSKKALVKYLTGIDVYGSVDYTQLKNIMDSIPKYSSIIQENASSLLDGLPEPQGTHRNVEDMAEKIKKSFETPIVENTNTNPNIHVIPKYDMLELNPKINPNISGVS
jgi:hypothetical protein